MSNALFNALPPLFILSLFGCTYYIYVYDYCFLAVTGLHKRITYLFFLNIIALMFLWSLFATMCSSVGKVPEEYKFNRAEHNNLALSRTEDDKDDILEQFCEAKHLLIYTCTPTGSIRYCSTCMMIKPDRAHHCTSCKTCFLKMDHHCPWVNNCIGYMNYKNFLLLLFYAFLFCSYYVMTTLRYVIYSIDNANIWMNLPIGLGFGFGVVVAITTFGFLCYHLYLVGRNETTIENVHSPIFADDNLTFDLGAWQNFLEVFGKRWYLWFLPIFSSMGCGYMFLVTRK